MIVRTLDGILGTNRDVRGPGWQSRRLILAADAMGCSVSDTIVAAGTEQRLHYKHHLETNYCISGEGEVEDLATGQVFPDSPGSRLRTGQARCTCRARPHGPAVRLRVHTGIDRDGNTSAGRQLRAGTGDGLRA